MAAKAIVSQESGERLLREGLLEAGLATQRCCGSCGKFGHNIWTCQEVKEISDKGSCIEYG
jgi:hypothetical protein